ncbi:GNAT family N-acetyltransferase [Nesterenkonia ebinurensis]|uniref:GNAT family N-acetyltransferase n=1 Tax=Nesterenkonia ebinurensis TaxID=2608252 RepID=UPI00123DBD8E|nr:GNAT family protein [Nesterenkonia ebinurensis]
MLNASLLPLSNDRASIRPLHPNDATAFAQGTKDPLVQEYAHLPESSYTPDSAAAMIHGDASAGLERGDLAVLAIAEPMDGTFAGSLVFFNVAAESAEVGFWVHPEYRGSGMSAAALELSVDFARHSELKKLTARTAIENTPSQYVLARAGFHEVSRGRGTTPSGSVIDLIHYARSLDESALGRELDPAGTGSAPD